MKFAWLRETSDSALLVQGVIAFVSRRSITFILKEDMGMHFSKLAAIPFSTPQGKSGLVVRLASM